MTTSTSCEEWRDVPGYEGIYLISNTGRMMNAHGQVLKPFRARDGYMIATLCKAGTRDRKGVHRLVGQAFIPNPEDKPEINHKNGIRHDNRVENLEWVTTSENNLHRRRVLHGGGGRPKRAVICIDTGIVYESITEASRATQSRLEHVLMCCKGQRKKTNGLRWAYKEEASK